MDLKFDNAELPPKPALPVVRIETDKAFAEEIELRLAELGLPCCSWSEVDRADSRIELFCASEPEAHARREELARLLDELACGRPWTLVTDELPAQDWQESWKRFFHTERVSPRIVVKPSWESFTPGPGDCVLQLDPGMSFGTGQHGTTRACLRFIDQLAAESSARSLLDAGCGSGILAIAAARLGLNPVTALDNDPDAVRIARENAGRNDVSGSITWHTCGVADLDRLPPHDIVVANILAEILESHADAIARAVSPTPGSRLVLAGILDTQYTRICSAFALRGFQELARIRLDEWTSGLFGR